MRFSLCLIFVTLALFATCLLGQVATTSSLDGTVTDPQGAAVAGAQVVVTNVNNGQTFKATTNDSGYWILPSMSNGVFKVGVTMQGFRTETVENVKIDAGVPTTANVKLELGSVSETVEVTGGAELVQTANATVNTTLEGRFVAELPEITRGGLDLLVAPSDGAATRSCSITTPTPTGSSFRKRRPRPLGLRRFRVDAPARTFPHRDRGAHLVRAAGPGGLRRGAGGNRGPAGDHAILVRRHDAGGRDFPLTPRVAALCVLFRRAYFIGLRAEPAVRAGIRLHRGVQQTHRRPDGGRARHPAIHSGAELP